MNQRTHKSSRFEQVFYNTGVGIMIVDKDRVLIEVNPKFCEMLGFTKEELLGKNAEIIHLSTEMYKEFGEKAFKIARDNQIDGYKIIKLQNLYPRFKSNIKEINFQIENDVGILLIE